MAKNQFQMHILWFSFHADIKMQKTSMKPECTLSFFRNLATSVGSKKPSALVRREEDKAEFLERQFNTEKLSFAHKKESEHSFKLCLPTCVFYQRIFNLEIQNYSLVNHHMMNARQPFS